MLRLGSLLIFILPLSALAQNSIAPPVPTGTPLDVPPVINADRPWWLEGTELVPAEATAPPTAIDGLPIGPPRHPTPPPAVYAGSACNFNPWCGDNIFSPDYSSTQVLFGAYSNTHSSSVRKEFNYLPLTYRTGFMLTAPDMQDSLFAGNWECLADLTAAPIVSGYGKWLFGPSVHLRRNFVSPGAALVPYTQVGAGVVMTNAHKEPEQDDFGDLLNMTLHAHVGLRYFITDRVSLDIEGGWQHLSKFSTAHGINALGAQVGFTFHFPSGGQ